VAPADITFARGNCAPTENTPTVSWNQSTAMPSTCFLRQQMQNQMLLPNTTAVVRVLQATETPMDRGGAGGYHVRSRELCSDRKHTHSFLESKHGYIVLLQRLMLEQSSLIMTNVVGGVVAKQKKRSGERSSRRDFPTSEAVNVVEETFRNRDKFLHSEQQTGCSNCASCSLLLCCRNGTRNAGAFSKN